MDKMCSCVLKDLVLAGYETKICRKFRLDQDDRKGCAYCGHDLKCHNANDIKHIRGT